MENFSSIVYSYVEQEEKNTLNQLLFGFDQMDSKKIITALKHSFIKSLDIEYAKLARSLQQKHEGILERLEGQSAQVTEDQPFVDDEVGLLI